MYGKPKDKAAFVCGCMGTTHKPVNNCLNCGRIVCQNESRDNCLACGQELIPLMNAEEAAQNGASASTVAAYKLKVRLEYGLGTSNLWFSNMSISTCFCMQDTLLVYDREHAKRTQVHDAQADYYESATWLTSEEKARIDEKERLRRKTMGRRPGSDMQVAINLRGGRYVLLLLPIVQ
jgi:activating signal cointegrator 1